MENIFKPGEIVYEKNNIARKLIVRRYVHRIYYCKLFNDPANKDLVFFERELTTEGAPLH